MHLSSCLLETIVPGFSLSELLVCYSVVPFFWLKIPIVTDMEPTFTVNLCSSVAYEIYHVPIYCIPCRYVIKYVYLTSWTLYLRYALQTSPLSIFTNNRLINFLKLKEVLNKILCSKAFLSLHSSKG